MKTSIAVWLLRVGLAFVFFYASVEIFVNQENFLKYIPYFVLQIVPKDIFLPVFAVVEVVLGVWLLTGWKGQYAPLLSAFLMAGIVVFNMEYFSILFRNVAICFGSLALVVLEGSKENQSSMTTKKIGKLCDV